MRGSWTGLTALLALAATNGSAARAAETATVAPACATTNAALPPELAGWLKMSAMQAGTQGAALPRAEAGVGYTLMLAPAETLSSIAPPGKPAAAGSYGGMLSLDIARAGTYVVALGAGAWVDVVKNGQPLASIAHGHGPACSTIRKTVEFALDPGHYTIQLAGNAEPTLDFLIARKP